MADGIPPEEYETWVAGFEDYPVDHRYYEIVHESLRDQCAHYYLFLKDSNGMTRAIQPFLIVSQDLATGTPAFIRNALAQVRRLVPGLLKLRMLMVGCWPTVLMAAKTYGSVFYDKLTPSIVRTKW